MSAPLPSDPPPQTPDNLTPLLSTLPPELRLQIYSLCLPCTHHRRARLRADYLPDSTWLAVSPSLFADAAPLVFAKPFIYMHASLRTFPGPDPTPAGVRPAAQTFDALLVRAFPDDHLWTAPRARAMLTKLALTLRYGGTHGSPTAELPQRLAAYVAGLSTAFPALRELRVSLAPEWIPRAHAGVRAWVWEQRRQEWQVEDPVCPAPLVLEITAAVRAEVGEGVQVAWVFDRAGMPDLGSDSADRARVGDYLVAFHEWMDVVWKNGGGRRRVGDQRGGHLALGPVADANR